MFMIRIGLIREGKVPHDNRVALTPEQCKRVIERFPEVEIQVQSSPNRCFSDEEYLAAGFQPVEDVSDSDILLGIKEVPVSMLIPNKTYLFFSHTVKKQPYNRKLFQAILQKNITLIDYELLKQKDGTRILGFGYFAGVVGAHNGLYAYGKRTDAFQLERAHKFAHMEDLFKTYKTLSLPPVKIVVTGSGRVSRGILRVMEELKIQEVSPMDYINNEYNYPVYTHLKAGSLYVNPETGEYNREEFHGNPENYICQFRDYIQHTDILMNGIFWNERIPRLFEPEDISSPDFRICTIADITDDKNGSVPCNLGDSTIVDPVYGVDRATGDKTAPYLSSSIDIMAVGNLPNELPRDASHSFGEELISGILPRLIRENEDPIIENATMVKAGNITQMYAYLEDYGRVEAV